MTAPLRNPLTGIPVELPTAFDEADRAVRRQMRRAVVAAWRAGGLRVIAGRWVGLIGEPVIAQSTVRHLFIVGLVRVEPIRRVWRQAFLTQPGRAFVARLECDQHLKGFCMRPYEPILVTSHRPERQHDGSYDVLRTDRWFTEGGSLIRMMQAIVDGGYPNRKLADESARAHQRMKDLR